MMSCSGDAGAILSCRSLPGCSAVGISPEIMLTYMKMDSNAIYIYLVIDSFTLGWSL